MVDLFVIHCTKYVQAARIRRKNIPAMIIFCAAADAVLRLSDINRLRDRPGDPMSVIGRMIYWPRRTPINNLATDPILRLEQFQRLR